MPSTWCNEFNFRAHPRYFGTFLASKKKDQETGHYLITLTRSLALRGGSSYHPTIADLFGTYRARNKTSGDIVAILEDDCIRMWDSHARNNTDDGARRLRDARYHAGDGFVFPIDVRAQTILIPAHYVEKLHLKRDIIVSASYDDLDPGETFCIHKPRQYEKILKRDTKPEAAHQR